MADGYVARFECPICQGVNNYDEFCVLSCGHPFHVSSGSGNGSYVVPAVKLHAQTLTHFCDVQPILYLSQAYTLVPKRAICGATAGCMCGAVAGALLLTNMPQLQGRLESWQRCLTLVTGILHSCTCCQKSAG